MGPQKTTGHDPWLTGQRAKAAILVAEDELTDEQIAAEVKIAHRKTIWEWRQHPAFQRAVGDHIRRLEMELSRYWIAKRRKRVAVLQKLADAHIGVLDARARAGADANAPEPDVDARYYDEDLQEWIEPAARLFQPNRPKPIPGLETGLLAHDVKSVGYGDDAELVDVYRADTGLSAELRNILKQAAQEVGQWSEKYEIPGMGKDETQILFYLPEKGSNPPVYPNGLPTEPDMAGWPKEGEDDGA